MKKLVYLGSILSFVVLMAMAATSNAKPATAALPSGYEVLKLEAGIWDGDMVVPGKNGKPATHYKAVQVNTLIANGMWMLNDLYMPVPGKNRYHGHGTWSYDPARKVYVGTWVDSNFATMRQDYGVYDAAKKVMYWMGEQPDNLGHVGRFRMVEQFSRGKRVYAMSSYSNKLGRAIPCATITFTRRGGAPDPSAADDTQTLP